MITVVAILTRRLCSCCGERLWAAARGETTWLYCPSCDLNAAD
jgi:hypothetical protein